MTRSAAVFAAAVLLSAAPLQSRPEQAAISTPDGVTRLKPGAPVERQLQASERHTYEIELQAGECAGVTVDQQGVDVIIQVGDASGADVATFNDEPRKTEREHVAIVADTSRSYRLTVSATYSKHDPGRYAIWVDEVRAATDRDRAVYASRQLNTAASALHAAGKFDEALEKASKALELAQSALGPNDAYVGSLLFSLAGVQRSKGMLPQAESGYQRAISVTEAARGHDHPHTGTYMETYGVMLVNAKDDYVRGEPLMLEGTAIVQRALGDSPRYALCLRDLAILHRQRGDYRQALTELQHALEVADRTMSPNDYDAITIVNNLGDLYVAVDDFDHAQPLTERALHDFERTLGPDHYRVTFPLVRLSIIARERGDYDRALEYLRRAYAIREKTYGKEHTETAALLITMGNVYHAMKDYEKALEAYDTARDVLERTAGPYHSFTVMALTNAARSSLAAGNLADALRYQVRLAAALDKMIAFDLAVGSEREKLAYIQTSFEWMGHTISLHLRYAPDVSEAADLAAAAILRRKGRVLDALSDSREALRAHMEPDDRKLLDTLAATTRKLSQFALNGPGRMPYPQFKKQLEDLESEQGNLEREISDRSAQFRVEAQMVTPASIRAALPREAALVEFAVYLPGDPGAVSEDLTHAEAHYAAYVIRRDADARGVDLGPAPAIDAAVTRVRAALRNPARHDVVRLSRALDELVLRPVRSLTGDATQLLVAPDGALNLIPFEALVDEAGRFQVERYDISYLGSGRELLRMQIARPAVGPPLIVAAPDFGTPPPAPAAARSSSIDTAGRAVYFAPLVGTAQEAAAIAKLLPGATVLTGLRASKTSLARPQAPSILHVASHAFFVPDEGTGTKTEAARSMTSIVQSPNPLLRSGIALAGANLPGHGSDAGILTALEASTLNLWGTRLVTLSACDTGIGDVRNGEGVYGLRRAFFVAGAESVVMSLWPVSDYMTRTVMTRYYAGLAHGEGRGAALRHVQRATLANRETRHPFYWAGFIQAGDWTPIQGLR
ncbi:MAG TPA: CHAT domain-containing tetratricopeptide repeat protein [Vicinamibacterales bacterium]|jgi:CHAT domain-containing protein/Tfp pilus assembly protein PilF|nr:CHAT domain-containing tetratricopeptide repeat protein [Vicinamibacterales bacterium]